jgi:uncharacterized protein YgiM (DUF1202 family)
VQKREDKIAMKKVRNVTIAILILLIALIATEDKIPSETDREYYLATAVLNVRSG